MTHYGISPTFLGVTSIRLDVFHCKCAIIRRMMGFLRALILKQSTERIKDFTNEVLRSFWSDYHIYCWNNKLNFSSFKGNELVLFIINTRMICNYLLHNLIPTDEVKNFVKGLTVLQDIFEFTSITHIHDREKYKE